MQQMTLWKYSLLNARQVFDQVKTKFKELNDWHLHLLQVKIVKTILVTFKENIKVL